METTPYFLTGVYGFTGTGLDAPAPLDGVSYTVPADKRSQLIYFRGGNSAEGLVAITLMRDGKPFRTFPIGAQAAMHVPLAVVEDLEPESKLEIFVAAPAGVAGEVVLDIGWIEV